MKKPKSVQNRRKVAIRIRDKPDISRRRFPKSRSFVPLGSVKLDSRGYPAVIDIKRYLRRFEADNLMHGEFDAFVGRLKKRLKIRADDQIEFLKQENKRYIRVGKYSSGGWSSGKMFLINDKETLDALNYFIEGVKQKIRESENSIL